MTLTAQLAGLIAHATLVQQLHDEIAGHPLLWLRPSANSFSLISCANDTPQGGTGGLHTIHELQNALQIVLPLPNRNVPEARLQSWLIRNALATPGRTMTPVSNALGGMFYFVSDEICLMDENGVAIRADLLLVHVDLAGLARLVSVELKIKRTMSGFAQAVAFQALLARPELSLQWRQFATIMTGQAFNWNQAPQPRALVIWPQSPNPVLARAAQARLQYPGVDALGYLGPVPNGGYMLEIE